MHLLNLKYFKYKILRFIGSQRILSQPIIVTVQCLLVSTRLESALDLSRQDTDCILTYPLGETLSMFSIPNIYVQVYHTAQNRRCTHFFYLYSGPLGTLGSDGKQNTA